MSLIVPYVGLTGKIAISMKFPSCQTNKSVLCGHIKAPLCTHVSLDLCSTKYDKAHHSLNHIISELPKFSI